MVSPPAHSIYYGYYLTQGTQPSEVYQSTNIAFLGGPVTNEAELLQQANEYSSLGIKKFIVNLIGITPGQAKTLLPKLGVFGTIVAIYPIDEPNVNGCDETILTSFRKLGYPMFAIYGPQRFGFRCSQYFDWLGLDDYETSTPFNELEALGATNPTAQLVLVPGGASPWNQNPKQFYDYSQSHPRVVAIIPFLWYTPQGSNLIGIRDNGMATQYTELGKQIGPEG